jgi:hypothetical protein
MFAKDGPSRFSECNTVVRATERMSSVSDLRCNHDQMLYLKHQSKTVCSIREWMAIMVAKNSWTSQHGDARCIIRC